MFADRAKIYIRSGKGGDGHVSFRREKYVPDGGPDGGDGGDGGSVYFVVDEGMNTLADYRHVRKYKAEDGEDGGRENANGFDSGLFSPGTLRHFRRQSLKIPMAVAGALSFSKRTAFPPFRIECFA